MRSTSADSNSGGRLASIVGGRPVTIAARALSMPASRRCHRVLEQLDAVVQQLLGDRRHVDAHGLQRVELRRRVDRAVRVAGSTLPWSATAFSVASGIVLTVCGAISSSTYIVSG